MDFLDRIGQLNIPTGLQGSQGPAGSNGAGWTSGSSNPTTAPPASIKYFLQTTSGQIFEWNGTSWASVITTIKGTNGNVWFSGLVPPVTVPGAVANDYYLDTVAGSIYKLVGVNWALQLTIKGTNGTPGINGTGLLGSAYSIGNVVRTTSGNSTFTGYEIAVNGLQAFPTLGSVVRATGVFKSQYGPSSNQGLLTGAIFFSPRIINQNTSTIYDVAVDSIDSNVTSPLNADKRMLGVSVVNSNPTHGYTATAGSGFEYANSGLTNVAVNIGGDNVFPFAHTKYVLTAIRVSATSVIVSVDWTTTTRYGTYTGFYAPTFINTLDFSSSGGIAFNVQATVTVPSGNQVAIFPIYHIVEKSIL